MPVRIAEGAIHHLSLEREWEGNKRMAMALMSAVAVAGAAAMVAGLLIRGATRHTAR